MVLISIQPFAMKKIFLLVAALLCLSSAICFADPLFMSLHGPRYDRQLKRIQAGPAPVQERAVEPHFDLASQSLDGRFAPDSASVLSESFVLDSAINWMACRGEDIQGRSYPVCASPGSRKYRADFSLSAMN